MTTLTLPTSSDRRSLDGLLDTRFHTLASNTIDYWMLPDDDALTQSDVLRAIDQARYGEDSTLQLYLHVPFCAQRCRFCAFSGGNSLDFKQADRFASLLIAQLEGLVARSSARGQWVRAVNIGGGSPDLLGPHVGRVLRAVRALPGVDDRTELAVELTLATTRPEFIEELVRHDVTKASFGVQTTDPTTRGHQRQPKSLADLDRVLGLIDGRIPVVNADLITGLPGQDLGMALADLRRLMEHPGINAVSSYVLTPGAAPALLAAVAKGQIPAPTSPEVHARMRLITYATFARAGWTRRGTNTFYDVNRIPTELLERLAGNECIGTARYEDFLLGVGPQAVSCLPGARIENLVDVAQWALAVERGEQPLCLPKCSTRHQQDIALWAFPLRFEGLPRPVFERARQAGAFTDDQLATLTEYVAEGLVLDTPEGYRLSILGEVFMGHLVRGLKNPDGQRAVDEYIEEGQALGRAIADGQLADRNQANNRQQAGTALGGDGGER